MIGPSNPVISIGPILAVPGMREAIAASPAPVVAVSPYVAGAGRQGADRPLHGGARPPLHGRRRRLALRRADRRDGRRRGRSRPAADRDPDASPPPTLMEGAERPRPPRPHRPRLRRYPRLELKATAILPVKRFDAAKQRLAAGVERRAAPGAGGGDARRRAGGDRRGADDRAHDRRQRRPDRPGDRRRRRRRGRPRPEPTPATSRPPWPASPGPRSRAPSCVVLLPGDCPLLDPRELDRLLTGVPERYVGIVPDRHGAGHQRAGPQPPGRDRPRLRRGQPRPPRRRRPRGRDPLRGRGAGLARARPRHPRRRVALTRELETRPGRRRRTARALGI